VWKKTEGNGKESDFCAFPTNSADGRELEGPLETFCPLLSFGLRLTLTELPVLGDHLAVAAVALTGIGAVAVYTAALLFTRVLVAFVHICDGRQGCRLKRQETETVRTRGWMGPVAVFPTGIFFLFLLLGSLKKKSVLFRFV